MKRSAPEKTHRLATLRTRNVYSFYILFFLLGACILFYYFGQLVDLVGWKALRWDIFYTVHDVHRLLFLAPIVYAAYVFGTRATIIVTILSAMSMLPRAIVVSPYPDPLLRAMFFVMIEGIMGYLTARTQVQSEKCRRLEALVRDDRDKLAGILERMQDGVVIIGPDYRIRFLNPAMTARFGPGLGRQCYSYLHKVDQPCRDCKLSAVTNGATERWVYTYPDGKTYEVMASPFTDQDGAVCQLATFRDMTSNQSECMAGAAGQKS